MSVVWEDPPPVGSGKREAKWKDLAADLRAKPNTWARVDIFSREKDADHARRGLYAHGVHVAMRKIDGEGWGVWAMWAENA